MLHVRIEEARGQKRPSSEIQDLEREYLRAEGKRLHGIVHLTTIYLTRTAQKYLIPVPEITEEMIRDMVWNEGRGAKWSFSEYIGHMILNEDAERELRVAIRAYRRERLEASRLWITSIGSILTGLIGVLIGLLSITLGRHSGP